MAERYFNKSLFAVVKLEVSLKNWAVPWHWGRHALRSLRAAASCTNFTVMTTRATSLDICKALLPYCTSHRLWRRYKIRWFIFLVVGHSKLCFTFVIDLYTVIMQQVLYVYFEGDYVIHSLGTHKLRNSAARVQEDRIIKLTYSYIRFRDLERILNRWN
jgi:hypothetical protein